MIFKKYLLVSLVAIGILVAYTVLATSKDNIVYPIAQLGNCEAEASCFAYCDDPSNLNECIAFAKQHNLLSESEIEKAERFQSLGAVGPGGCTSEAECENYCENISNIDECLAFAEEHGFMEEHELKEARKIQQALAGGAQLPGGCTSEETCEAYCENIDNIRECVAFAEEAGFMSPEELREVQQVIKALDAGIPFPGDCRGEDECEIYCEDPNHIEECVEFGIAAGFIPADEAEEIRRMLPLMKEGKMPGGCREREECEAYCSDDAHVDECTTFFVEAGFMSQEEAAMFRETGGRGPGGCSGRDECEAFCNDPSNQEACFEFGREHGLIPEHELQNIQEGIFQLKEVLTTAPPEVALCLRDQLGPDVITGIQNGTFLPGPEIGDKMRQCFELQQEIIENQMRGCLVKSCDEFFGCMEALSGGPGGAPSEEVEHRQDDGRSGQGIGLGILDQEIQIKIDACVQEQFGGDFPSEFDRDRENQFPGGPDGEFFPPDFNRQRGEFIPEGFRDFLPVGAENLLPHEIEELIRQEQFQGQFDEQIHDGFPTSQFQQEFVPQEGFDGQDGFLDQFQQLIPQFLNEEQGSFTPDDFLRIEEQESFELQIRQQEEEALRLQLEQQLEQQFLELQQLQQQEPPVTNDTTQGSILEAARSFFQQLLGR